jgi:hypothetical protein
VNKKVIISMIVGSILISGCAMFQPSTYENTSTDSGNQVSATGRAADNAALANTSYRGTPSNRGYYAPSYYGSTQQRSLAEDLMETTQSAVTQEMGTAIRRGMREVTNNLFNY